MANDELFDPFDLQEGTEATNNRPVLISVSQGNSDPSQADVGIEHNSEPLFDPFGVGSNTSQQRGPVDLDDQESAHSPELPPQVTRVTRSNVTSSASVASTGSMPLPPKLLVKLAVFEEVSSVAKVGPNNEGSSEVSIEGTISAQVQCSDAKKNAPFALLTPPFHGGNLHVRPNSMFTTAPAAGKNALHLVKLPKHEIGKVQVAFFSLTEEVRHMPILLERKVTIHDTSVRVAIQVRSKLTNQGDMKDFAIALAMPEHVDGSSVEVLRGEGGWDELKRTVKWKLDSLEKGESFMVSAQAKLWKALGEEDEITFPVMLRCTSTADQISTLDFQASEAEGYPSSLTSSTTHTFRLLHRLT